MEYKKVKELGKKLNDISLPVLWIGDYNELMEWIFGEDFNLYKRTKFITEPFGYWIYNEYYRIIDLSNTNHKNVFEYLRNIISRSWGDIIKSRVWIFLNVDTLNQYDKSLLSRFTSKYYEENVWVFHSYSAEYSKPLNNFCLIIKTLKPVLLKPDLLHLYSDQLITFIHQKNLSKAREVWNRWIKVGLPIEDLLLDLIYQFYFKLHNEDEHTSLYKIHKIIEIIGESSIKLYPHPHWNLDKIFNNLSSLT